MSTFNQPTDALPTLNGRPVHAGQFRGDRRSILAFHGPHFVCNMEGLALECVEENDTVKSGKFNGGRNQQWSLQPGPQGHTKFAFVSLHNGQYLGPPSQRGGNIELRSTPFYWDINAVGTQGALLYSLSGDRGDKLALPLLPARCRLGSASDPSICPEKAVKLLILSNTTQVRAALEIGRIGQWAYPTERAYLTAGTAGQIRVYNHLASVVYAAVSDGRSAGSSGCGQYPVKPNNWQYWKRSSNEDVHVSLGNSIGAQSAQVFQGHVGKILHIQTLPSRERWEGINSVLADQARYIRNEASWKGYIGVQNNLKFNIYVLVLSTVEGGSSSQYTMYPGKASFWSREGSETVLVSVGGAPGAPRAFLGKLGFTLQINDL